MESSMEAWNGMPGVIWYANMNRLTETQTPGEPLSGKQLPHQVAAGSCQIVRFNIAVFCALWRKHFAFTF